MTPRIIIDGWAIYEGVAAKIDDKDGDPLARVRAPEDGPIVVEVGAATARVPRGVFSLLRAQKDNRSRVHTLRDELLADLAGRLDAALVGSYHFTAPCPGYFAPRISSAWWELRDGVLTVCVYVWGPAVESHDPDEREKAEKARDGTILDVLGVLLEDAGVTEQIDLDVRQLSAVRPDPKPKDT